MEGNTLLLFFFNPTFTGLRSIQHASTRNELSRPVRIIQPRYHDERTLSDFSRKSRLSSKKTFRTLSVGKTLLIVTDRMDLPAELIALMYRYRWQNDLSVLPGLGCLVGTHRTYRKFEIQRTKTTIAV